MPEQDSTQSASPSSANLDRARDHLANERTFLAWVRTGIAIVVFGFAIGRFSIAIRQFMAYEGRTSRTAGMTVWFGTVAIIGGVILTIAGWLRYRHTRQEIESGGFEPAGFIVDLVGVLTALFGVALAVYLVFIEFHL